MRHEPPCPRPPVALAPLLLSSLLALTAAPALAQYKVVGPDGSVTYTDRPPATQNARVTAMGRNAVPPPAGGDATLPAELRTATQRHPVTLYTSDGCPPCDTGRRLLQQRGVPYSERRVITEDDAAALERLLGARTVPALSIGAQPLRGFNELDWTAYLDAAGYPRENRLPRSWQAAPPRPLVDRATPTPAVAEAAPAPAASPEPEAPPPGTIRF